MITYAFFILKKKKDQQHYSSDLDAGKILVLAFLA